MLNKLNNLKKKKDGFTIIEVLIVLAIAALIMVIVLIAIPQLQRNQRNTARRAIGSRIAAEIGNFIGNNNGVPPAESIASGAGNFGTIRTAAGFWNRYLGCGPPTVAAVVATPTALPANYCATDINDPLSGFPMSSGPTGIADNITVGVGTPGNIPGDIDYNLSATCNGELGTGAGTNRTYALTVRMEGNSIACFDNN